MRRKSATVMSAVSVSSVEYSTALETRTTWGLTYSVSLSGTGSALLYIQGSVDGVVFYDLPNNNSTHKKYLLAGESAVFSFIENVTAFTRLKLERISGTPVVTAVLTSVGI